MSKGVAIPYIIALVIGIIVVVIVVYWIYSLTTTGKLSAEECRAKFIDWCTMCRNIGWTDGNKITLSKNFADACDKILSKHFGFGIVVDCDPTDDMCNKYCHTWKTKADCCTVGVKNDVCA